MSVTVAEFERASTAIIAIQFLPLRSAQDDKQ
jgi:hypothetical protein